MADMRTSRLNSDQLCRLLALGLDSSRRADGALGESASTLLLGWLTQELPGEGRHGGALSQRPTRKQRIGDFLSDPASDLRDAVSLKECAKKWVRQAQAGAAREAAATVYYAAIAVALVRHGQRISRLSPEGLSESFVELTGKPWMTGLLRTLFRAANLKSRDGSG
jgi:hypothetical protein